MLAPSHQSVVSCHSSDLCVHLRALRVLRVKSLPRSASRLCRQASLTAGKRCAQAREERRGSALRRVAVGKEATGKGARCACQKRMRCFELHASRATRFHLITSSLLFCVLCVTSDPSFRVDRWQLAARETVTLIAHLYTSHGTLTSLVHVLFVFRPTPTP